MITVSDIPKHCIVCEFMMERITYNLGSGIIQSRCLNNACGFYMCVKNLSGHNYVQFNFDDLNSAVNYDFELNEITLNINEGDAKIHLPLDKDYKDFKNHKDYFASKIKKFRNFS